MVDDDEDVRNLGARTVSAIFSVNEITTPHSLPALSLSPPAAKQRLLLYLSKSYQTSKSLCIESIRRLTGAKPSTSINPSDTQSKERQDDTNHLGLKIRPVAKVFRAARLTSTDIFVEERQNLYIDTVSEAESWAEVLIGLDSEAWSTDLASSLETWTVEGLTNIIEEIDNGTDESPGPTSKSEIFSLFTQVILTAKVIISRAPQISPKEKSKEHGCIGLLEDLMKFGRAKSLHDLLLDRISSVLEDAMAGSGC